MLGEPLTWWYVVRAMRILGFLLAIGWTPDYNRPRHAIPAARRPAVPGCAGLRPHSVPGGCVGLGKPLKNGFLDLGSRQVNSPSVNEPGDIEL